MLNKLIERKELLIKFHKIEKKITEILKHNREDDVFELINDESDIIESIHLLDYDISIEKDFIKKKTGRNFEDILIKNLVPEELADNLKKSVSDSRQIISELAELKKSNIELLVNYTEDLSLQIRELEIMDSLLIISPKDLQSL
jgi:hypothetical protein